MIKAYTSAQKISILSEDNKRYYFWEPVHGDNLSKASATDELPIQITIEGLKHIYYNTCYSPIYRRDISALFINRVLNGIYDKISRASILKLSEIVTILKDVRKSNLLDNPFILDSIIYQDLKLLQVKDLPEKSFKIRKNRLCWIATKDKTYHCLYDVSYLYTPKTIIRRLNIDRGILEISLYIDNGILQLNCVHDVHIVLINRNYKTLKEHLQCHQENDFVFKCSIEMNSLVASLSGTYDLFICITNIIGNKQLKKLIRIRAKDSDVLEEAHPIINRISKEPVRHQLILGSLQKTGDIYITKYGYLSMSFGPHPLKV